MGGKEMKSIIERLRRARQREEGFTLIELLIVILILGILAGIAIFASAPFQEKATTACVQANEKIDLIAQAATAAGVEGDLYVSSGGCDGSGGAGGPGGPGGDAAPAGSVTASNSGGTVTANTSGITGSPSPTFTFSWQRGGFSFNTSAACPSSGYGSYGGSRTSGNWCYRANWTASNSEGSINGTTSGVRGG
jgi:prepilin-type N-terminal cleavage/methylation domain-containing protein